MIKTPGMEKTNKQAYTGEKSNKRVNKQTRLNVEIALGYTVARVFKLQTMLTSIKSYLYKLAFIALTHFEGHQRVRSYLHQLLQSFCFGCESTDYSS